MMNCHIGKFIFATGIALTIDAAESSAAELPSPEIVMAVADSTMDDDQLVEGYDTIYNEEEMRRGHRFTDSRLYQSTFVGIPLIVTGFVMKGEDTHFRKLRFSYAKHFHRPIDNYTQYVPAAVMYGLKAIGVESRSSWGRMVVSDAASAVLMAAVTQGIKSTSNVTRPDGSDNKSFPSGHTATAFMCATMLSKEYGHISPWVSVGAYTFASATGLMRIANNKHWMSDVLTGAGVGIITTELGYWIGDLIFKDRGINHFPADNSFSRYDKPSFLSVSIGLNIPLSHYDISEEHEFRTSSGSVAGIEGAWFFTPYIGIGGRLDIANSHIITSDKTTRQAENAEHKTYDVGNVMVGPYFSLPVSDRWNLGSKVLIGCVDYRRLTLDDGTIVPRRPTIGFGSGISAAYKVRKNYGVRFFLDYNLRAPHSKQSGEWMSTLALGTSFGVNF